MTIEADAQASVLTSKDLQGVQNEIKEKLNRLCKHITTVGNTPQDRSKTGLNKAGRTKRKIIENDVPVLFWDYKSRNMKTSWYDKTQQKMKFRTKKMEAYFIALLQQSMSGRVFRSYEIWIEDGYIGKKLGDPKNWKKERTLVDGSEVWRSTVNLIQDYQSVIFQGSVEQKSVNKERDRKTLNLYMIKMPQDLGGDAMVLLGDVIRTEPK